MGELFSIAVFIILVISSIAKKLQDQKLENEERKRRAEMREQRPDSTNQGEAGSDLPPETRRMLYGEPQGQRQARPRQQQEARPLSPEELLETMLGVPSQRKESQEEEEGEWQPVHQPRQRRELQRPAQPTQMQRDRDEQAHQRRSVPEAEQRKLEEQPRRSFDQARPQQPQRTRTRPNRAGDADRAEARAAAEHQRAEQRRKLAEQKQQQAEAMRRRLAAAERSQERDSGLGGMFDDINDVRRGLVMMEVLGPCRALREFEPPSESQQ